MGIDWTKLPAGDDVLPRRPAGSTDWSGAWDGTAVTDFLAEIRQDVARREAANQRSDDQIIAEMVNTPGMISRERIEIGFRQLKRLIGRGPMSDKDYQRLRWYSCAFRALAQLERAKGK